MKNKGTILLTVLLVVLLMGAAVLYQRLGAGLRGDGPTAVAPSQAAASSTAGESGGASSEPEAERIPVPAELSFTDPSGNTVTLGDLRGKPLVINFWASWCGFCRKEMPDFSDVYSEYGDEVQFIMLNVGETREVATDFMKKNDLEHLPVYYDDIDLQMARAFGASGLPMTFFIDSEGVIAAYEPGMTTAERLKIGIGMIHQPSSESVPETAAAAAGEEVVNPSWCTMEPTYTKIDPENAKSLMDESVGYENFYIVDVRTEAEYKEKHIPGAMLLPLDELADRAEVEFPDHRSIILVYCRSGRRSEQAAKQLVEMGYNHVYDFGGINDWPYDIVSGD